MTSLLTSQLAQLFERIYILNLPDRADRRRDMAAELERAHFPPIGDHVSFFPGTRVSELQNFPSLGARGCFLSHLAILKQAKRDNLANVMVLEDDLAFSPLVAQHDPELAAMVRTQPWDFIYFGHTLNDSRRADGDAAPPTNGKPEEILLTPTRLHIVCLHFYAIRNTMIAPLIDFLEAIPARPPGHPDCGPMHVDGAYNEFRERHPQFTTLLAHPSLGHQRSSRSDIDIKWFDRAPGLKQGVSILRTLKNRLK